jgi:hypothetical protein
MGWGVAGQFYSMSGSSKRLAGGESPLGYGAGGDVVMKKCYASSTQFYKCAFPEDGKDGVVIIDVFY